MDNEFEDLETDVLCEIEHELYNKIKEQLDKKGNDTLSDLCEVVRELTLREG